MKTSDYEKLISSINLFFTIFGFIGNLLTFIILIRKNLRNNNYIKYLASLCIVDIFCLFTWNFSLVYQDLISPTRKRIEFESALVCRLFAFISYYTLQSSSWLMCAIGMDRVYSLLSRKHNLRQNSCLSQLNPFRNPLVTIFLILGTLFFFNFVVLVNNAEPFVDLNLNSTRVSTRTFTCYSPESFFKVWDIIHLVMYSLLPFILIFFENIIIIFITIRHSNRMKRYKDVKAPALKSKQDNTNGDSIVNVTNNDSNSKRANRISHLFTFNKGAFVTNLLLFLTISFICTTLPYSMYYATKANDNKTTSKSNLIIKRSLGLLQYLRHSTNFIIYVISSSIIRNEISSALEELKRFLKLK